MTRRYRVPALQFDSVDVVDPRDIVERTESVPWIEKALGDEATRVRGIALSVADAAVFAVAQVFAEHGLVDGVFDVHDNDAIYKVISEIAGRRIYDRLLGKCRADAQLRREVVVAVREYGR